MIEILCAAFVPPLALWLLSGTSLFDDEARRAARRWFIPLVLAWFAPCWLTGRTPAPFDYLKQTVIPWQARGFTSANELLSDVPLQLVPWREAVRGSLLHGEMPFLNRYAGSGSPLWENPQAAPLYALTLLGLPFSGFAWPLFAGVAKILVALTGMYFFLRATKISHAASIAGATVWGFGTFTIVWLQFPISNVTVLLPFLLLSIERCAAFPRASIALAIVTALILFGGHPESAFHCIAIGLLYALRCVIGAEAGQRRALAVRIAAGAVAGLMLAAPILIPFVEYLPLSERVALLKAKPAILRWPGAATAALGGYFAGASLLWLKRPVGLVNFNEVVSHYAGVGAFGLALGCALSDFRRRRFWILLLCAASLLALPSFAVHAVTSVIPLVGMVAHARLRFAILFCIAVLAACAVDGLDDAARRRRILITTGAAAIAASVLLWSSPAGIVALVAAFALLFAASVPRLRAAIPLLLYADLAALLVFYNPPVARSFYYPQTPALRVLRTEPDARVAGVFDGLRGNSSTPLGIENIGTHDPMSFEPYGEWLARSGYNRTTYFETFVAIPPRKLLDELGVRWIVAPPWFRSNQLPLVYAGDDAKVFMNPTPKPQAWPEDDGAASVAVVDRRMNRETIVVRALRPVRIRTWEVRLPGWRLTRNGARWPIVGTADPLVVFDAPAGESRFELRYLPVGFKMGSLLAAGGVLILLAMLRPRTARLRAAKGAGR